MPTDDLETIRAGPTRCEPYWKALHIDVLPDMFATVQAKKLQWIAADASCCFPKVKRLTDFELERRKHYFVSLGVLMTCFFLVIGTVSLFIVNICKEPPRTYSALGSGGAKAMADKEYDNLKKNMLSQATSIRLSKIPAIASRARLASTGSDGASSSEKGGAVIQKLVVKSDWPPPDPAGPLPAQKAEGGAVIQEVEVAQKAGADIEFEVRPAGKDKIINSIIVHVNVNAVRLVGSVLTLSAPDPDGRDIFCEIKRSNAKSETMEAKLETMEAPQGPLRRHMLVVNASDFKRPKLETLNDPVAWLFKDEGKYVISMLIILYISCMVMLMMWTVLHNLVDVTTGLAWEVWLLWGFFGLSTSLVEVCLLSLRPGRRPINLYAKAVFVGHMPLISERVDTFKDLVVSAVAVLCGQIKLGCWYVVLLFACYTYFLARSDARGELAEKYLPVLSSPEMVHVEQFSCITDLVGGAQATLLKQLSPARRLIATVEDLTFGALSSYFLVILLLSGRRSPFVIVAVGISLIRVIICQKPIADFACKSLAKGLLSLRAEALSIHNEARVVALTEALWESGNKEVPEAKEEEGDENRFSVELARLLKQELYDAKRLKENGFNASSLNDAGFTVRELMDGGFDATELLEAKFDIKEMKRAGCTAQMLRGDEKEAKIKVEVLKEKGAFEKGGFDAASMKKGGYGAKELKEKGGFTVAELREGGFFANSLKAAGFNAKQLKAGGFEAWELKHDFEPWELKEADFDAKSLRTGGFDAASLRQDGFPLSALREAGFDARDLKNAGFELSQLKDPEQIGENAFSIAELMAADFDSKALKQNGFNAADLKKAGFDATFLKRIGFDLRELRAVGFEAVSLRRARFTAQELKNDGLDAESLRTAGFDAKTLKDAGFKVEDLKKAGFDAESMWEAGFEAQELNFVGFPFEELEEAGFDAEALQRAGLKRNS
eukprot:gnl/TRDRNA2_/TRDRNA2_150890_c0_seq1.p1 gnl/TRDRNA2_/TRDRNA2_150890_c0~~gnl/TRDRNA2_/TRDRNA2_150890_c0_seq1.p1  ORF type:complete len:1030 (+),score=228.40 gnl/TRDRNA2_/TRDRNA2_150890_c0_seq1:242-3091(+)